MKNLINVNTAKEPSAIITCRTAEGNLDFKIELTCYNKKTEKQNEKMFQMLISKMITGGTD